MKNSTLSILIFAATLFTASFGYSNTVRIGSGGDGLIDPMSVDAGEDVEVPYPGGNPDDDSLVVKGKPGPGQSNQYCVYKYMKDSEGQPIKFSSKSLGCPKLGESLRVSPGYYFITYSSTLQFVTKKANEKVVVELRKIKVPKHNGKISFHVFADFTNREMQTSFLMEMWVNEKNKQVEFYCSVYQSQIGKLCEALDKDYMELQNTFVRFSEVGASYSQLDGSWSNYQRLYITDPKDGEFVSVLPGVYGIEWHPSTNYQFDTFGIVVK